MTDMPPRCTFGLEDNQSSTELHTPSRPHARLQPPPSPNAFVDPPAPPGFESALTSEDSSAAVSVAAVHVPTRTLVQLVATQYVAEPSYGLPPFFPT